MTAMLDAAAKRLFHALGGVELVRFRNRHALRILMYHRFTQASAAGLERQCEHLRANYHILAMADVARLLSNGDPFPQNALAITVDDGHADFYHHAFPVFQRYGLPATLYLTTGFIDQRGWLWFDLVDDLFERTTATKIHLEPPGAIDMPHPAARIEAATTVKEAAIRMPDIERVRLIERLPGLLGVDVPASPGRHWEALSWKQIGEMASYGIEFGAHTLTHPILSRVDDPEQLDREIREPKRRIEQELDREAIHFCYPNGQAEDFTPAIVERVRAAGFQTATVAIQGLNRRGADAFRLSRVAVEPDREWGEFTRYIAGLRLS